MAHHLDSGTAPDIAPPQPRRPFRREGALLAVGALSWALSMALGGVDPATDTWQATFHGVAGGVLQLGLLALLRVLWRTRALGTGRPARSVLRAEAVVLVGAIGSTVADTVGASDLDVLGWALLDACWPLSMLGMFLIGIRIAIAGRWRGASRFWPMGAESWAVVVIPTVGILGDDAARVVAPLHLLVGYTVLGVLVARKEG